MSETARVLVIAAHPDDETLGCAGTLLRHKAAGTNLHWLIITEAQEPQWTRDIITRKTAEIERAAAAYGMDRYVKLGFPSARLDSVPQTEVMERIRAVISDVRPGTIYLVHGGDVHSDHRFVFTAAMSVLKPIHMRRLGVQRVLSYEILSSTEAAPSQSSGAFLPNIFVDITDYMDRKIELMNVYQTERQNDPLPRGPSAIRALARYRGTTIGVEYAEAFMLIRELV